MPRSRGQYYIKEDRYEVLKNKLESSAVGTRMFTMKEYHEFLELRNKRIAEGKPL